MRRKASLLITVTGKRDMKFAADASLTVYRRLPACGGDATGWQPVVPLRVAPEHSTANRYISVAPEPKLLGQATGEHAAPKLQGQKAY